MKKILLGIATICVVSFVGLAWANPACNVDNCREQDGSRWSVGGSIDVISGGEIDIESGAVFKVNGIAVTPSFEIVTATNVITAAESGVTFFLNSGTEFISTLPLPAIGLKYKFIISAAPSGANYTIVTTASANIMNMMITSASAGDAGEFTIGRDVITFVGSGNPGPSIVGDWVECTSDGTSWFCAGTESIDTGITVGQTG